MHGQQNIKIHLGVVLWITIKQRCTLHTDGHVARDWQKNQVALLRMG